MIYLDNSATSYPKPLAVREAAASAVRNFSNPGRSGHKLSIAASEEIFSARKTAAQLFDVPESENVVFTLNCTAAINTVIKGVLKSGDHVVVSELEHNSVMRPLEAMKSRGVTWSAARVFPCDDEKTLAAFRDAINARTKMIICTQASNVWGVRLPVERISALAHGYGLTILVDAAQSAGVIPIDIKSSGIDYLCSAGHKGLYGPMGTGLLIVSGGDVPESLIEGGTGSSSDSFLQPGQLPDRLESGTPNVSGIAGLRAGMAFVMKRSPQKIAEHEFRLIGQLYRELSKTDGIRLYMPQPTMEHFVPILSLNVESMDSESAGQLLSRRGIAVRAGLHCSPAAHRAMGTLESGAVRVSPSVFTTENEIDRLVFEIKRLRR